MKYTEINKAWIFLGRLIGDPDKSVADCVLPKLYAREEATTLHCYMAGQPFDLAQDLRRPAQQFAPLIQKTPTF